MKLRWQNKQLIKTHKINKQLQDCLFQTGSLTRYLQQRCEGTFHIELKSELWRLPMQDESAFLGLRAQEYAFIRESWLKSGDKRLVYARTIIPRKTLLGKTKILTNLGTKPLGEILFADKTTYRSNTRYAKIPVNSDLYNLVIESIKKREEVWGRQSLFYIQNRPLLISEVFLPQIIKCIQP